MFERFVQMIRILILLELSYVFEDRIEDFNSI